MASNNSSSNRSRSSRKPTRNNPRHRPRGPRPSHHNNQRNNNQNNQNNSPRSNGGSSQNNSNKHKNQNNPPRRNPRHNSSRNQRHNNSSRHPRHDTRQNRSNNSQQNRNSHHPPRHPPRKVPPQPTQDFENHLNAIRSLSAFSDVSSSSMAPQIPPNASTPTSSSSQGTVVFIRRLPSNTNKKKLLGWIRHTANTQLGNKTPVHIEGDRAWLTCQNAEQANQIIGINNKSFRNSALQIQLGNANAQQQYGSKNNGGKSQQNHGSPNLGFMGAYQPAQVMAIYQSLKVTFKLSYDYLEGRLNFSNLRGRKDQFHGQASSINFNNFNFIKLVSQVLSTFCPLCQHLDLSKNGIVDLEPLGLLSETLPYIKTLDLKGNQIQLVDNISHISKWKLEALQLDENPCCILPDNAKYYPLYRDSLCWIFPTLKNCDGIDIPPMIEFSLPSIRLPPSAGNNIETAISVDVKNFLLLYFRLYDSNRNDLAPLYQSNAFFSLSLQDFDLGILNLPDLTVAQQNALKIYHDLNHNILVDYSSRFYTIGKSVHSNKSPSIPNRAIDNLQTQNNSAIHFLTKLPQTKHDLSSFTVDAMTIPSIFNSKQSIGVAMVSLTGVFLDHGTGLETPFSRTFLLGRSPPGSMAHSKGYRVEILNDSMILHLDNLSTRISNNPGLVDLHSDESPWESNFAPSAGRLAAYFEDQSAKRVRKS